MQKKARNSRKSKVTDEADAFALLGSSRKSKVADEPDAFALLGSSQC